MRRWAVAADRYAEREPGDAPKLPVDCLLATRSALLVASRSLHREVGYDLHLPPPVGPCQNGLVNSSLDVTAVRFPPGDGDENTRLVRSNPCMLQPEVGLDRRTDDALRIVGRGIADALRRLQNLTPRNARGLQRLRREMHDHSAGLLPAHGLEGHSENFDSRRSILRASI